MDNQIYPLAPAAVAIPILAIMTLIVDIPPFIWHVKNQNLAASALVFWIILGNLFNFINALIWPRDDIGNWWQGQGLCDIEVKIMAAATVGVCGCLACIMRNLANVLNTDRAVMITSKAQRKRRMAIDSIFCFGFAIYIMLVHYIVQPSRYYIFAIAGCTVSYDDSWPSWVLIYIWPPILSLVDVYYGVLVMIRVLKYRKNFSAILSASNSNLNKSRFIRLFAMGLTLILVFLPVQCYILFRYSQFPFIPYSWSAIHGPGWGDITLVPMHGEVVFDRWIQITFGFTVFVFFGLGKDATTMYRKWLLKLGFGRVFSCLHKRQPSSPNLSVPSSYSDSFSSKVFTLLGRKQSHVSLFSSSSRNASVATNILSPSTSVPTKSGNLSPISEHHNNDSPTSAHATNEKAHSSPTTPVAPSRLRKTLNNIYIPAFSMFTTHNPKASSTQNFNPSDTTTRDFAHGANLV